MGLPLPTFRRAKNKTRFILFQPLVEQARWQQRKNVGPDHRFESPLNTSPTPFNQSLPKLYRFKNATRSQDRMDELDCLLCHTEPAM